MKTNFDIKFKMILLGALCLLLIVYFKDALAVINKILDSSKPLIYGLIMALLIKPLMSFFERRVFKKLMISHFKRGRLFSLLSAILVFILIIGFSIYILVPQVMQSFSNLASGISEFILLLNQFIERILDFFKADEKTIVMIKTSINDGIKKTLETLFENIPNMARFSLGFFVEIGVFAFSFVFSVYILYDKEKLKKNFNQFVRKTVKKKPEKIISLQEDLTLQFEQFFSGQVVEAIILGALCLLGMYILKLPYPYLVSFVMAITAVVPLIGAYAGTIPSALLILIVSPVKALIFIIFILILQFFEGNLIYPYVVGQKVDLPAIVILFAVIFGGSLLGILGVLISVPLTSVFYKRFIQFLYKDETVQKEKEKDPTITTH